MSEERGKRDDGTAGSEDHGPVDESDVSGQFAHDAVSAEESPTSAAPAGKPSGKRSARRVGAESAAPSEVTKKSVAATSVKAQSGAKAGATKSRKADSPRAENIFKRLRRFLREVIAELRKVIWPNRKQMVTYTSVVLVFVAFMVTFISLLDLGFIKGVSWLFG